MPNTLFIHCSRMFGKFTSSLLKGSRISRFPFLFFHSCKFWQYSPDSYFSTPAMFRVWPSSLPSNSIMSLTCWGEVISLRYSLMAKKTLQGPFCHGCLFLFGTVTLRDSEVVVKDFSLSCNAANGSAVCSAFFVVQTHKTNNFPAEHILFSSRFVFSAVDYVGTHMKC